MDKKDLCHQTAIVVVPPKHIWPGIQYFREMRHHIYEKWCPHLTILYPFLNKQHLMNAQKILTAALCTIEPFELNLNSLEVLEHGKSATLILTCKSDEFKKLGRRITKELAKEYSYIKVNNNILLHLSLAKFNCKSMAYQLKSQWETYFNSIPLSFTVDRVHILQQEKEGSPMNTYAEIQFQNLKEEEELVRYNVAQPMHCKDVIGLHMEKKSKKRILINIPTFKWNSEHKTWIYTEQEQKNNVNVITTKNKKLTILTYNILMNNYEKDKIYSKVRWTRLIAYIGSLNIDIIALQEVDVEFIQLLLDPKQSKLNHWVHNYCVSDVTGITCNPYGQLLLVKKEYSVKCTLYRLTNRKTLLFGKVETKDEIFHIAVVHLTSNHSFDDENEAMQLRISQMNIIHKLFNRGEKQQQSSASLSFPSSYWNNNNNKALSYYILGDFNYGDGSYGEEHMIIDPYVDVWPALQQQQRNKDGFTFDPKTNSLAYLNSLKKESLRLDRQLYYSKTRIADAIDIIGKDSFIHDDNVLYMSDHYGLLCKYNPNNQQNNNQQNNNQQNNNQQNNNPNPTPCKLNKISLNNINALLQLDEKNNIKRMETAIEIIKESLLLSFPENIIHIIQVGSSALSLQDNDSDVDVIVVGNCELDKFFKTCKTSLLSCKKIRVIRHVGPRLALVPVIVLDVAVSDVETIQVDIQYSSINIIDKHFNIDMLIHNERKSYVVNRHDTKSMLALNGLKDIYMVKQLIKPSIYKVVSIAYQAVKKWAKAKGIYSNRLGFLGGFGWLVMLLKCIEVYPKCIADASLLLNHFYFMYANYDYTANIIQLNSNDNNQQQTRNNNEYLIINTLSSPHKNIARNITKSSLLCMINEMKNTLQQTCIENIFSSSLNEFITGYSYYIDISCGDITLSDYDAWIGYIESRLCRLLNALESPSSSSSSSSEQQQQQQLENKHTFYARLWPKAFAGSQGTLSRHYYIGIGQLEINNNNNITVKRRNSTRVKSSKQQRKKLEYIFQRDIDVFMNELLLWREKTSTMHISISYLLNNEMTPVEELVLADEQEEKIRKEWLFNVIDTTNNNDNNSDNKNDHKNDNNKPFISSEQLYNRLRWDHKYDPKEFTVVYEDCFAGMKESPLLVFRSPDCNVSHDSFIPWHRVWYFKKSGVAVWDREKKIDSLFGTTQVNNSSSHEEKNKKNKKNKSKK